MSTRMVSERLQSVFREVFDDDRLEISEATRKADIPGWDSLADVRLIIGIEEEYRITFSTPEIGHLHSVGDVVAALARRGIRG